MYKKIDDMSWPVPCLEMGDVEWMCRHSEPNKPQLLYAAAIISAYKQMIIDPAKKRNMVVTELRKGED